MPIHQVPSGPDGFKAVDEAVTKIEAQGEEIVQIVDKVDAGGWLIVTRKARIERRG